MEMDWLEEEAEIPALNAGYVEDLYLRYRESPESVDPATRRYFEHRRQGKEIPVERAVAVVRLAQAIRKYGHRASKIDPLDRPAPGDDSLLLQHYSLSQSDLSALPACLVDGPVGESAADAGDAISTLRRVYCSTRGYDYGHIHTPEERVWLQETAESGRFRHPRDPVDGLGLLKSLTRVEAFERFLDRMLPGKFRFSIEGLDMLVPLLEEILGEAAEKGVGNMILGMAHRGRLNVLVHVLNKPYAQVMAELSDPGSQSGRLGDEAGFRGDVTYHMGARRAERTGRSVDLVVTMPPNPSHVEAVDPVVEGMARAAGCVVGQPGAPRFEPGVTLPVLIHGDAAFPGQGVVAETLNLGRLPAYRTGGTIHVIANNGLGFTTDPRDLYSTHYASDLAKGFDIPVLHVNADDPEAVIEAGRTAVAFLSRFHKDFLIDLVGYRRRGHNESDEPSFTQPLLYARIAEQPTVRQKWAARIVGEGRIDGGEPARLHEAVMNELREAWKASKQQERVVYQRQPAHLHPAARPSSPTTSVPLERLRAINAALLELPPGFALHPKLETARAKRREILDQLDEKTIDWATAEELALASILSEGTAIRLTGEDVERGTFSQRHAVFHDAMRGVRHVPLQSFSQARASFEIANSPLSENAILGFEVGGSLQAPERLTIWEAQYGDFANGAQVVLDELVVSAREKWGVEPSLVLLLPHGYEGHGPDHSSARIERFLSLSAGDNLRIANATTAAQYFHLLRLQAALLADAPRPLVVFTPKGLLRHPAARSSPRDLTQGAWMPVIDDERSHKGLGRHQETRILLCTGKVYVELAASEEGKRSEGVSVCRLEQLYPFPRAELAALVGSYPELDEVVWVQEEPENMGAWSFVRPRLRELLPPKMRLRYAGRSAGSSPAEGSYRDHLARQEQLVKSAFETAPALAGKEA